MEINVGTSEQVAQLVRHCLEEGQRVEIDGLGVFERDSRGGYKFTALSRPRIFLGYVMEDLVLAERLFEDLEDLGFAPWLDRRKMLPGQNWPRAIEEAIETSDFFLPCFSRLSVRKKGSFQAEIRYALDCACGWTIAQCLRRSAARLTTSICFPTGTAGCDELSRLSRSSCGRGAGLT